MEMQEDDCYVHMSMALCIYSHHDSQEFRLSSFHLLMQLIPSPFLRSHGSVDHPIYRSWEFVTSVCMYVWIDGWMDGQRSYVFEHLPFLDGFTPLLCLIEGRFWCA